MKSALLARALVLGGLGATVFAQAPARTIVVTGVDPATIADLTASAPPAVHIVPTSGNLAADIANADGLVAPALVPAITAADIKAAKHLGWIQILNAGVEDSLPLVKNTKITLTSLKGVLGPEVADHAMALLLALTRDLYQTIPARAWAVPSGISRATELGGKTAVVIGVGGVGSQIAQRASGFGMTVIGVDPKDGPLPAGVKEMVKPDRLNDVLARADVVFITVPDTPATKGMMGAPQFAAMKTSSYFIAVSRGTVYSLDALVDNVKRRHLAGAGLDVTDPEPLPATHPVWQLENVIITPHIAGASNAALPRIVELLKQNIRLFAEGKPLLSVVDKEKGY
jgi:phosphoglycerate dehydrogenase-like enzyme